MTLIRVNDTGPSDRKAELMQFWKRVGPVIALAVDRSFYEANMATPTRSEVEHRVLMCKKLVEVLKNDLHWTFQRIEARLPDLLRRKLLGVKSDIEAEGKRGIYAVDDAAASQHAPGQRMAKGNLAIDLDREFGDAQEGDDLNADFRSDGPVVDPRKKA